MQPRRRAHCHPKNKSVYRPVTTSGCPGRGNQRWTRKQVQAVQNIAAQGNMVSTSGGHFSTLIRMALQAPHRLRNTVSPSATLPVIWDSGASISITHERSDFVGPINNPGPLTQLQRIAKGLWIEGQGHVMWAMEDTAGNIWMIKVPATWFPRSRSDFFR